MKIRPVVLMAVVFASAGAANAGIYFGGQLPPLRLNERRVISLEHTDGVGLGANNANTVTLHYPNGQTETFSAFQAAADTKRLVCMIYPTKMAGRCSLDLHGTNDDVRYTVDVETVSELERRLQCYKRNFSLVDAIPSPSSSTSAFVGGAGAGTTMMIVANDATVTDANTNGSTADEKSNSRKAGALRMSGTIFRATVRTGTLADANTDGIGDNTKWFQFGTWRYVSSGVYQCTGLTEKLGSTAGGADVSTNLAGGTTLTFDFRRPLYARAGDYFGIVVNQPSSTESCLAGDDPGAGARTNIFYKNAAPTGVGSNDTLSGLNGRLNIHAWMQTPYVMYLGDSWASGYTANQSSFDTNWEPVDVTSDPALLLADRMGLPSVINAGIGGQTWANVLTRIAAGQSTALSTWEPAVVICQAGGNDVLGQSAPGASWKAFKTTLFGEGGIAEKCATAGARLILCNIGPFDADNVTSYTLAVGGSATAAREVDGVNNMVREEAGRRGIGFLDVRGVMAIERSGDVSGNLHDLNANIRSDTVHPAAAGYAAITDRLIGVLLSPPMLPPRIPAPMTDFRYPSVLELGKRTLP